MHLTQRQLWTKLVEHLTLRQLYHTMGEPMTYVSKAERAKEVSKSKYVHALADRIIILDAEAIACRES